VITCNDLSCIERRGPIYGTSMLLRLREETHPRK